MMTITVARSKEKKKSGKIAKHLLQVLTGGRKDHEKSGIIWAIRA